MIKFYSGRREIIFALLTGCQILILCHTSSFITVLFPSKAENGPDWVHKSNQDKWVVKSTSSYTLMPVRQPCHSLWTGFSGTEEDAGVRRHPKITTALHLMSQILKSKSVLVRRLELLKCWLPHHLPNSHKCLWKITPSRLSCEAEGFSHFCFVT